MIAATAATLFSISIFSIVGLSLQFKLFTFLHKLQLTFYEAYNLNGY